MQPQDEAPWHPSANCPCNLCTAARTEPTPRIRIQGVGGGPWMSTTDCLAMAVDEEGQVICSHISSSWSWARSDMGLTLRIGPIGAHKHRLYRERYPNGYILVDELPRGEGVNPKEP